MNNKSQNGAKFGRAPKPSCLRSHRLPHELHVGRGSERDHVVIVHREGKQAMALDIEVRRVCSHRLLHKLHATRGRQRNHVVSVNRQVPEDAQAIALDIEVQRVRSHCLLHKF